MATGRSTLRPLARFGRLSILLYGVSTPAQCRPVSLPSHSGGAPLARQLLPEVASDAWSGIWLLFSSN
jgi:hypothetical protein